MTFGLAKLAVAVFFLAEGAFATELRTAPMVPLPKAGSVRCDLLDQNQRTTKVSAILSQSDAKDNQPQRPQISLSGENATFLDGNYQGWFTSSNQSISFSNVNKTQNTLVILTLFGVDWSSKKVAMLASVSPIGKGDRAIFVGFCDPQWKQ